MNKIACSRLRVKMGGKMGMANALSVLRIILSVALLAPPALSPAFLVLYAAAGLTDMLAADLALIQAEGMRKAVESIIG